MSEVPLAAAHLSPIRTKGSSMTATPKRSPWSFIAIIRPTFLEGMARIFDLSGSLGAGWMGPDDFGMTPEEYDRAMLAADWKAIAEDMRAVGLNERKDHL